MNGKIRLSFVVCSGNCDNDTCNRDYGNSIVIMILVIGEMAK